MITDAWAPPSGAKNPQVDREIDAHDQKPKDDV